ncbi:MAG TPA: phage holin family protein [Dehalococcoidia bacterium]|jgi:putative membrane protein|nr:phage holin family protein [Dehalococcoidia bacterium]
MPSYWYWEWRPRAPRSEDFGLFGLVVRFVVNVAALWVAQALVRGFDIDTVGALVFGAIIFGLINALIRPVVAMFSCLLTMLTLGLFTLIINTAMLGLTAWIAGKFDLAFRVDGFIAAFLGALVISLVSLILTKWATANILRPSVRRW